MRATGKPPALAALAALLFLLLALAAPAAADLPTGGRVIKVAPGTPISVPSIAASLAQDGDVVEIAAAEYAGDVAVWRQDNLTIRGVNGRPHLKAAGKAAEAKAIWVIRGDNVRIENIEFSGARVRDLNGAGIRSEGAGLVIENCYFHHNEMGVMSGKNLKSDIVIRNSEFFANIVPPHDGWEIGHNIYIGTVRSFTLVGSKIHGARHGHNVKSRAAVNNIIDNEIFDGPDGRSSYLIDLPAGGVAVIRGNRLHRNASPDNTTLISYGAEKALHAENSLRVIANRIINDYRKGIFIHNHLQVPAEVVENHFTGPGTLLRGPGKLIDNRRTGG